MTKHSLKPVHSGFLPSKCLQRIAPGGERFNPGFSLNNQIGMARESPTSVKNAPLFQESCPVEDFAALPT